MMTRTSGRTLHACMPYLSLTHYITIFFESCFYEFLLFHVQCRQPPHGMGLSEIPSYLVSCEGIMSRTSFAALAIPEPPPWTLSAHILCLSLPYLKYTFIHLYTYVVCYPPLTDLEAEELALVSLALFISHKTLFCLIYYTSLIIISCYMSLPSPYTPTSYINVPYVAYNEILCHRHSRSF